jgi:hypothetical protein
MHNPLQIKTIGTTDSPELIDIEKPEQGLELHVGSNVFRNTNGVVKLQGKEQLVLETQLDPSVLILTMDLYDERGTRIGHIRRNALSANSASRFTINVKTSDAPYEDPPSVTVADLTTGRTVFEACLMQRRKVRITVGNFYTHKGDCQSTLLPHWHRSHSVRECRGEPWQCRGYRLIGPPEGRPEPSSGSLVKTHALL